MSVVITIHGNDLEFIGVCLNFPYIFESVDMVDGSLCGKGAVIWVESVGGNLGDVVGVSLKCFLCGLLVGEGRCR